MAVLDGEVEEKRFKFVNPEDELDDAAQQLVIAATPPTVPGAKRDAAAVPQLPRASSVS